MAKHYFKIFVVKNIIEDSRKPGRQNGHNYIGRHIVGLSPTVRDRNLRKWTIYSGDMIGIHMVAKMKPIQPESYPKAGVYYHSAF